jgi:hypothetical protein
MVKSRLPAGLLEQGLQLFVRYLVLETTALGEHHQLLLDRLRKVRLSQLYGVESFPGFGLKDLLEMA